jgi:hypothetical protein
MVKQSVTEKHPTVGRRTKHPMTKKRKIVYMVLGSLVVLLIAIRIALPYILLKLVNKELAHLKGYYGHVEDIDVALIRGAYTIKDIKLEKVGGKVPVPFFSADAIDLAVEWKPLFHGSIVGKIRTERPILNFVKGPTEATSQTSIDSSWTDVVKRLMPLKINRLEFDDGEIHYRDYNSDPKVDIFTKNVHILAGNLSNGVHNKELLPSTAEATATVYGGTASLHMKLNVLSKIPVFEARAELKSLDITNLNNFLQAYGKFDVKRGEISIYMEAATKDNVITGYTKPIIKDLKVVNWDKDKDKPLKIAWEAVIGSVAWVFKNHGKDQLATKIEFSGDLKKPDINIFEIIGQVLYNGFIQALYPSLENSVSLNSVKTDDQKKPKTFLGKMFKKGDKKKGDDKKEGAGKNKEDKKKDAGAGKGKPQAAPSTIFYLLPAKPILWQSIQKVQEKRSNGPCTKKKKAR